MKYCPVCYTAHPTHQTKCPDHGVMLIESRQLEPGVIIREKYKIVRLLETGGMGVVYLAEHMLRGKMRALKFLSTELAHDPKLMQRFRQEAQIELRHPNIVEVIDLEQAEDGSPFITMEFVEGPDLRKAMGGAAMPVERALAITRGVALGLGVAHEKGIIHRDVKPENIMLARGNGQGEIPKLLDFGIAAVKENVTVVSRTRGLMLTPEYAAPEQWKGMPSDQLDGRVDIYALGGVLHEMLTGRTIFHSPTLDGWMFQHLMEERVAPSRVKPELAQWPGLDDMVLRMLAKEREHRQASVDEFVAELDAVRQRTTRPRQRQETNYEFPNQPKSTGNPVVRVQTPPPPPRTSAPVPQRNSGPAPHGIPVSAPPPLPPPASRIQTPQFGAPAMPAKLLGLFKMYGRPKTNSSTGIVFYLVSFALLMWFATVLLGSTNGTDQAVGSIFLLGSFVTLGFFIAWLASGRATSKICIHYRAPIARDAAAAIFKALKELGFKPLNNVDIYLTHEFGRTVVSFMVQEGYWDRPDQLNDLTRIGRGIAQAAGGLPLHMQMVDLQRNVRKGFMVN
jgi:serine/threonine protein kinase